MSFFHKSVKDWLLQPNHDFTIIETYGHRTLADICVFQMETLKQNEVSLTFDLPIVYAFQYGIQHMLEAEIKDMDCWTKLINNVIDLEVLQASVCSDIYTTLSNLSRLDSYNMRNTLICEETQTTLRTLISIIRKFTYILKDVPQSFLQHVVNENDEVLSSKASALLMARYRGLAYFEAEDKKEPIKNAVIGRFLTENEVLDIDISPSEDFLICGYAKGVELFSLPDFKTLWKIKDFVVERTAAVSRGRLICGIQHRCIAFHPGENTIFPGQLTPVLNLEGKFESGRIVCKEKKFTSCCFSHDNAKMVTSYASHLTVWNLLENKKIVSLSCRSELFSVLFSANDRFIGTTNINELCVYDTENRYSMVSRSYGAGNYPVLVSKMIGKFRSQYIIVKYDLTVNPSPVCLFGTFPRKARAAAEVQAAERRDDTSWFYKVGPGSIFILSNESILVSYIHEKEIKLLRPTEVIQKSNKKKQAINWSSIFSFATVYSVSLNGRYFYIKDRSNFHIVKLDCPLSVKSIKYGKAKYNWVTRKFFVPVTNGVLFCGEVRRPSIKLFMRESTFFVGIPELWNFGVTQGLASFPELTDTCRCLSVSEDLVACIMKSQVVFFNVLKKAIVERTPFPELILVLLDKHELEKIEVIACSSLYHVLMGNAKSTYLLQHSNCVDLNSCVFKNIMPEVVNSISTACFSPNG